MKNNKLLIGSFVISLMCSCQGPSEESTIKLSKEEIQALSKEREQEEANKKLVTDMYHELFGDKNVEAIDKYIDERYIQHNPILPDGRDTLKKAAAVWFKGAPKEKIDLQHIAAEGDLVFIHTRSVRGGQTLSIIDIYRIENNLIVEHWDVIQAVPEKSANPHPMF